MNMLNTKEKCVMCGTQTNYDTITHIDFRVGYIEGVGQLCEECYNNIYSPKKSDIDKDVA
jgi:hypothetical protein